MWFDVTSFHAGLLVTRMARATPVTICRRLSGTATAGYQQRRTARPQQSMEPVVLLGLPQTMMQRSQVLVCHQRVKYVKSFLGAAAALQAVLHSSCGGMWHCSPTCVCRPAKQGPSVRLSAPAHDLAAQSFLSVCILGLVWPHHRPNGGGARPSDGRATGAANAKTCVCS